MPDEDEVTEPLNDEEEQVDISQWEFIDRIPTRAEVVALLETLAPVYGIEYKDFADHVQGLPSKKKVKKRQPGNQPGQFRTVEVEHEVVSLYFSVAGRIRMLNAAAEKHGWMVDFQPEPVTPTGVPGFLQLDERIVYREYVVIRALASDFEVVSGQANVERWQREDMLGSKPGMAWVPSSGGRQAAGSNPYEKVETAARGRAIAAWGIGILPGSGVASLEEMLGSGDNRQALAESAQHGQTRKSREELLDEIQTTAEEVRQLRHFEPEQMLDKQLEYLQRSFGIDAVGPAGEIDWAKVRDGQLQLTLNQLEQTKRQLLDQEASI